MVKSIMRFCTKSMGQKGVDEARYSPANCVGCDVKVGCGNPDLETASTSYIERSNLTMRMRNRRFTRLTNAFSKKLENHEHAIALNFFAYNFIFKHATPSDATSPQGWRCRSLVDV